MPDQRCECKSGNPTPGSSTEAVEVGLLFARNFCEAEGGGLDQIIIIGDASPNDAKMVKHLSFEFSSVRPGITHVLGTYKSQAALAFDLELEELLDMQYRRIMVKDLGKLKLDVNKVLAFLNEKMRF